MLFGGMPSQARVPPGEFVIWNLLFGIYLLFGAYDLGFFCYLVSERKPRFLVAAGFSLRKQ